MRREVPTWVAAVVIIVVVIIVAAIYVFSGTIRPRGTAGPTPETVKQKMYEFLPKAKGQGIHGPMGGHGAYGGHGPAIHGQPPSQPR